MKHLSFLICLFVLVTLNYNDQLYFELNEAHLAACIRMNEGTYLCDTPVLSTMDFTVCSVMTEIYNRTAARPCDFTELAINGVLWQKLMKPNTWLFTTNASTVVGVICDAEREDLHLSGSGIIQLQPGCMIKTTAHTLHSLFYLEQRVVETFIKETVLTQDVPVISKQLEFINPPPVTDPMGLLDDIQHLDERPPPSYFSPTHPWILLAALLGIFCFVRPIWKRLRRPAIINPPVSRPALLSEQFDAALGARPPQHVQP